MSAARLSTLLLALMILFATAQCVTRISQTGVLTLSSDEEGGDVRAIEAALDNIAYTSPKTNPAPNSITEGFGADGGASFYQISFRTCPPCIQAHADLLPKLQDAGLETRLVTTARRLVSTAQERAAVVENARRGDWAFTQKWWADKNPKRFYALTPLAPVEGDIMREAELDNLRNHVDMLAKIITDNGGSFGFPAFFWRSENGQYKAAIGYNPALMDNILADMERTP